LGINRTSMKTKKVVCPECGYEFMIHLLHGGRTKYCSKACKSNRDNRVRKNQGPRQLTKKQKLRRLERGRLRFVPIANETPEQRAKRLAWKKVYRDRNKDAINKRAKKARANDPERFKAYYKKNWAKERLKPETKEKRRVYSLRYRKGNIRGNISYKLRSRVSHAVRRSGRNKSASTMALLGCTIPEFQEFFKAKFTRGMTWQRFLTGEIHLDHIVPCASFDLTQSSEQKRCFHYTNMQPLWAADNMAKGAKII
jgi:hypothetical protein